MLGLSMNVIVVDYFEIVLFADSLRINPQTFLLKTYSDLFKFTTLAPNDSTIIPFATKLSVRKLGHSK
jgi:hypothetical protein